MFRIAQESLRNGIQHGGAKRFEVSVVRSGDQVELSIADDGRGFDLDAARRNSKGLGLVSMEERARAVGADVEIASQVGQGTTIRVRGAAVLQEASPADQAVHSDTEVAERFPVAR
jgi:signal transduction histidine kinase